MTTLEREVFSAGYGTDHPEALPDEVFICYELPSQTGDMDLPNKRLGTRVFRDDGIEVATEDAFGYVPVFANKAEHSKRYS
jgi:hypothetical protein